MKRQTFFIFLVRGLGEGEGEGETECYVKPKQLIETTNWDDRDEEYQ